jgi:2'-5' RNA ligase
MQLPATNNSARTISDLIAELRSFGPSLRPVSLEGLHLTLKFLGDVDDELCPEIRQVMSRVAENTPQFSISLCGLGTFPDLKQPSVVWAGVADAEPLIRIAESLSQSLTPLGFEAEMRRYRPHLTLARVKQRLSDDRLKDFVTRMAEVEITKCEVTELNLMGSQLTSSGPVYNKLESVALPRV